MRRLVRQSHLENDRRPYLENLNYGPAPPAAPAAFAVRRREKCRIYHGIRNYLANKGEVPQRSEMHLKTRFSRETHGRFATGGRTGQKTWSKIIGEATSETLLYVGCALLMIQGFRVSQTLS